MASTPGFFSTVARVGLLWAASAHGFLHRWRHRQVLAALGSQLAGCPLSRSISSSAVGWLVTFVPEEVGWGVGGGRALSCLFTQVSGEIKPQGKMGEAAATSRPPNSLIPLGFLPQRCLHKRPGVALGRAWEQEVDQPHSMHFVFEKYLTSSRHQTGVENTKRGKWVFLGVQRFWLKGPIKKQVTNTWH